MGLRLHLVLLGQTPKDVAMWAREKLAWFLVHEIQRALWEDERNGIERRSYHYGCFERHLSPASLLDGLLICLAPRTNTHVLQGSPVV